MIKKLALFLIGSLAGAAVCWALVYLSGMLFEYLGIGLYESEAEQQRNFNVVLLLSAVAFLIGGVLATKKYSK
ncbi:MAG TPA: hypothetical protein VIN38_15430 [Thiobacillus sp.]